MSSATSWEPLLHGDQADRAKATALELAGAIQERAEPKADVGVAAGAAGFALLHAYLARETGSADSEELALVWVDQAVEGIGGAQVDLSLYAGVTGVGWAGQHIARLLEVEDVDPGGELDKGLAEVLERTPWRADFDLISGLVGFGVYALERLPRPEAVGCLELIVARLGELAEHTPDGVTWHTAPALLPAHQLEETPDGFYNLGVAHGVPGVVALLGAVVGAGIALERARPLLEGAVAWLLRRSHGDGDSAFAFWIAPGVEPVPARTAWCYGDPGVAAALLVAAQRAGVGEWEREALALAHRAASRRGEETRVEDAWLCHGAAGLAHLFNRMHQASGDPALAEAALHWLDRTLEMRGPEGDVAGYRQTPGKEEAQGDGTGFLTGAAGVALTLLAAAGEVEPGWDRLLAISARQSA